MFMDAAHFVWQLYMGVLWCITRINVLGAYDPVKNELIKIVNRTYINSSTILECLDDINIGKKHKLKTLMALKFQLFLCSSEENLDSLSLTA